jgi:hypothetical protein
MSEKTFDGSRRKALKFGAIGIALAPLAGLVSFGTAAASDLPHVTEDDPIALGLKYKHDATQAGRIDKAGVPADQQFCNNCSFHTGTGDWVACSIFPGKAVNAMGWCTAWAPTA